MDISLWSYNVPLRFFYFLFIYFFIYFFAVVIAVDLKKKIPDRFKRLTDEFWLREKFEVSLYYDVTFETCGACDNKNPPELCIISFIHSSRQELWKCHMSCTFVLRCRHTLPSAEVFEEERWRVSADVSINIFHVHRSFDPPEVLQHALNKGP